MFLTFKAYNLFMLWVQTEASETFLAIHTPYLLPFTVRMCGCSDFVFPFNMYREEGRKGPQWACACVVYFRTRSWHSWLLPTSL